MPTAPLGNWSAAEATFRPGHTQLTIAPGVGGIVLVQFSTDSQATWSAPQRFSAATSFYVPEAVTHVRAQGAVAAGTFTVSDDGKADDPALLWRSKTGQIGLSTGASGEVLGLATNAVGGNALTASGIGYTGACDFWGVEVNAYNGGPQTVEVRDNLDGSGAALLTFTISGVGFYPYSGTWAAAGGGQNLSRALANGVYCTVSGGTSRTLRPVVTAA